MERTFVSCSAILIICSIVCDLAIADRTIEVLVNPNCTNVADKCLKDDSSTNSTFNNLVYVRATGSDDTLHYLWSSAGTLSLLFAITGPTSLISVNWTEFLANDSNSISFDPPPTYEAVVVFTNLYIYDDASDSVNVTNSQNVIVVPFNTFLWEGVEVDNSSSKQASAKFRSTWGNGNEHGQLLQFNINAFGYQDHSNQLPSLLHTANSLQLEMILDHFNKTDHTRFTVEIAVVNSEDEASVFQLDSHKSIDDEYTPGVFTVTELTSADSRADEQGKGTYLQWKPVCYTSTDRTTADSTVTRESLQKNATGLHNNALHNSLVNAYFGDGNFDSSNSAWMNISYGLAGDGFYDTYLSWTVTIGTGRPVQESFSTMVIAIIVVGFGVPAILIIVAGIIILVRRCRRGNEDLTRSNERLVDDDRQ